MINPKEYIVAALASLSFNGQRTINGPYTADQIRNLFNELYEVEVPIQVIEVSLDYAVSLDIAVRFDDPFTPTHFMLVDQTLRSAVANSNNSDSAFTKAKILGPSWTALALKGIVASGSLEEMPGYETGVPASDRIVTIGDNQRHELASKIDEISSNLAKSNAVKNELGEEADRIVAELKAGRELLAVGSARISALVAVLLKPLRYLAEKFSDGAIGALAGALVVELLKLI